MAQSRRPRLSQPLLPPPFVERLQRAYPTIDFSASEVYTEESHSFRLAMRNWSQRVGPGPDILYPPHSSGRTTLHIAAMLGDILYLCETLYFGATADRADIDGFTPIFIALTEAAKIHKPGIIQILHYSGLPSASGMNREQIPACLSYIARTLIEQHIDVNQALHGIPLLQLACIAKDWDIVSLLLEHGAVDCISTKRAVFRSTFPSLSDRTRFTQLVESKKLPQNQERPPRKCPCWSGEDVLDCHGKTGERVPYPPEYICICGTGKTYRRCCARKSIILNEHWDPSLRRILQNYDVLAGVDPDLRQHFERLQTSGIIGSLLRQLQPDDPTEFGKMMLERGIVDPAFGYGMVHFGIHQARWNKLIDDYIALGTDTRSKFEIERAAKIGSWGGPLIRKCEGKGCEKYEFRDVPKLSLCTKCKTSAYCGRDCQTSDWPTHKKVCGKSDQKDLMLPSQEAIHNYNMFSMNLYDS
ncbi:hypothetical protein BDZ97DRAFT_1841390 [Flammula alnicola]|nr:hypothetical protein BDZ97DRAFT_1841390 [Flammula alnicola]